MKCDHKVIHKNYPFGKKSKPQMYCRDCGKIIKPLDLKQKQIKKQNGKKDKRKKPKKPKHTGR